MEKEIVHYGAQTDIGPSVEGPFHTNPCHMASTSYYFLLLINICNVQMSKHMYKKLRHLFIQKKL